jgi:hypothetical protein
VLIRSPGSPGEVAGASVDELGATVLDDAVDDEAAVGFESLEQAAPTSTVSRMMAIRRMAAA